MELKPIISGSGISTPRIHQPTSSAPALYTDFASDAVPTAASLALAQTNEATASIKAEEVKTEEEKAEDKPKKPNPREEWLDADNPLHCKLCEFTAFDQAKFQNHSLSIRHIKRAAEMFDIKVAPKKEEVEKKKTEFHCQVCLCTCNSESAWNMHLTGQKHRKNLEKQGADKALMKAKQKMNLGQYGGMGGGPVYNTQFQHNRKPYEKPIHTVMNPNQSYGPVGARDFANYKEPLIGLEYVTEIQVTGQSPRYHCELCDSKFDHNLKFPHLVGAKHRFNVLKEKVPAVAQEIRTGIKKRSELTGKLLDEAQKLEQQEGRQQVKTRIEASPFTAVNEAPMTPVGRSYRGSFVQGRGGRGGPGRGYTQTRGIRGHPLKGSYKPTGRGSNPQNTYSNQNYNTGFNKQSTYNTSYNQQQSNSSTQSYGSTQTFGGQGQQRGRGRGRGERGQQTQGRGRGRGWRGQHTQQYNQSGYQPKSLMESTPNETYPGASHSATLLPKEAFTPQQQHQSYQQPYSYNNQPSQTPNYQTPNYQTPNYQTQTYGGNQPQSNWQSYQSAPAPTAQASATPSLMPPSQSPPTANTTSSKSDSAAQGILKNLTELGKLVTSEEDASVALQVSNALTQALLQYRMQSISGDETKE